MTPPPYGVLVMAYGGPDRLEDVEPYLQDVRGFRETPAAVVEEVRRRYAAIGGRSPILQHTRAQAAELSAALAATGNSIPTFVGMRHWHPRIEATLKRMAGSGLRRAVGLVMAPHYSRLSIDQYFRRAAGAEVDIELAPIRDWHLLDQYLDAVVQRVRAALDRLPNGDRAEAPIIFTAHSLPERIREWNDPYPDQLAATVRAVVGRLGSHPHRFAYQSAAMTPDPWLGPDVSEVLQELAAEGHDTVVIAPIGFTSEHVEVLYDVDIELRRQAEALDVRLERIEMVGAHPGMMAGLARLVLDTARDAGWT